MNKPLHKALLPGSLVNGQPATLGVMGGGQLGRMFVQAAQAMGLAAESALRENTALFAHGVGLLLLQHTGRIRMFGQSPEALFQAYVDHLVVRIAPGEAAAARASGQPDLFGG